MRADWQDEWEAELRHRERLLADWHRLNWRTRLELTLRCLGAFWDALWLQHLRLEDEVFQDLRYGMRMLLKHKEFTAVAVVTLALGIGANTAMFSVLNTYLLRALPYPNSERLVRIYRTAPQSQSWPLSPGNFLDQHEQNNVFERMAAFFWVSPSLAGEGHSAEALQGIAATADFFPTLGVQPALGRVFTAEEDQPGATRVVVLSDRFWQRRFAGDPNVVGRTLRLDGESVIVIGVMPPSFEHPLLFGTIDLWRPISFSPAYWQNRNDHWLHAIARLKGGVSLARAQEAMTTLAASIEHVEPDIESSRLEALQRSMSDDVGRKALWFASGLATFVLLIACANLANLQLARTAARGREYAVRAALGARRGRLMRQSLTESLAVSLIGGAFSLLFALCGVEFIDRRLFSDLPGAKVAVDFRVFGFALLCSVLTGLFFGALPAWLASRTDVNQALRGNIRGSTPGRSSQRLRHALIAAEISFALVLLTGAGLLLRGLERFAHLDPGWRVDGLLMAHVIPQGKSYADGAQRAAFFQKLEERVQVVPGVHQLALSRSQPVWGFSASGSVLLEGQPEPPPGQLPEVFFEPVSPQYFETLGVRLLAGRTFTSDDRAGRPEVVIINETMARRFWPDESPIGHRIGKPDPDRRWEEVVGVVTDVGFPGSLEEPYTRLQAFRPLAQAPPFGVTIALRTSAVPEQFANVLRSAIAQIDPDQPVTQIQTARRIAEQSLDSISLLGNMLGAFAALGLGLAVIGIYGVTSHSVEERTGEIGIRMALGAQRKDVLLLVLGKGLLVILFGTLLGLGGAYAVGRLLIATIPTLPTRDPTTLAVLTAGLILVALAGCYVPSWRATKVDPIVALRHE